MFASLKSRPDYFPYPVTLKSWIRELNTLNSVSEGHVLCLNERGFTVAGQIYGIWQKIKGFFGFYDETNEFVISAHILKLLYVGVSLKYIQNENNRIKNIENEIAEGHLRVHQAVKSAFQNLESGAIRNQLIHFYQESQDALAPSFWSRFRERKIELVSNPKFGDTHLAFAKDVEERDPLQAITHYRLAAQLYNSDDPEFLFRLSTAFGDFSRSRNFSPEIGEIYLLLAEKHYSLNRFVEASEFFQQAVKCLPLVPTQIALWMSAAAHAGQWETVKELSHQIPSEMHPADVCRQLAKTSPSAKNDSEEENSFEREGQNGVRLSENQNDINQLDEPKALSDQLSSEMQAPDACLHLARDAFHANRYAEALIFFEQAAQNECVLDSQMKAFWMICLTKSNEFIKADLFFEELFSYSSASPLRDLLAEAFLSLAKYYMRQGQWIEAEKRFAAAIRNGAELTLEENELRFMDLAKLGQFEEMIKLSDEIASDAPFHGALGKEHLRIAEHVFEKRKYEEAALFFSRGVDLTPRQKALWMIAAAETGQYEIAEILSSQIPILPPVDPARKLAGESYLLLANNKNQSSDFIEADRFFNLAYQHEARLTSREWNLWFIAAAKSGQGERAAWISQFLSNPLEEDLRYEAAKIYLILAESQYNQEKFDVADKNFRLAFENEGELTERHRMLWLIAAVEIEHFEKAEELALEIQSFNPSEVLRAPLANAIIRLADHLVNIPRSAESEGSNFFSFLWSEAPGEIHREDRAILAHYRQALNIVSAEDQITIKLLIRSFTDFAARFSAPDVELGEIYLKLAERMLYFHAFAEAEQYFYLATHNTAVLNADQTARWMLSAAKVQNHARVYNLSRQVADSSLKNPLKKEVQDAFLYQADRLYEEKQFEQADYFYQRAELYFLKGEILRKSEGDSQRVLDSFEQATTLAPGNPFGAGALFMEDNQTGGSRSVYIETYRRLALEWGAAAHMT